MYVLLEADGTVGPIMAVSFRAEAAAGGIFGQSSLTGMAAQARPGAVRKGGPKDANVGKTVKITKGGFKGHLAHITDATDTQYKVELHTKLKVLMIDKEKVVIVGDKQGAIESDRRVDLGAPAGVHGTPYLTAETPLHGSQTPMYTGNETPRHAPGTPGVTHDANHDSNPFAPSENDKYGGSGWGSTEGWGQDTDTWGQNNQTPASTTGDGWGASSDVGWGNIPTSWGSNPSDLSYYGSSTSAAQATSHWTGGADVTKNSNPGDEITFRDWVLNMVVVIVKGFHSGRQAVTQGLVGQVLLFFIYGWIMLSGWYSFTRTTGKRWSIIRRSISCPLRFDKASRAAKEIQSNGSIRPKTWLCRYIEEN